MGDKNQIKRLSIQRRVDLIFAFFRDAAMSRFSNDAERARTKAQIEREVQRQIENAIRDDREIRDGAALELSNEDLCPACGVPAIEHGSVKAGKWDIRVCAGVSGRNLFIIGQDAAGAFIEQLREKHERKLREIADRTAGGDTAPIEPDEQSDVRPPAEV